MFSYFILLNRLYLIRIHFEISKVKINSIAKITNTLIEYFQSIS